MKVSVVLLAAVIATASASERNRLEFSFGGGVWMPALLDSDAQLDPGPAITVSLQIPPSLGSCFIVSTGYLGSGSGRGEFNGVSAVPLTVGYRMYPFYRKYAGPRGIEPLLGVYAGGALVWDSPEGNQEGTTTGAGIIGAEFGTRITLGGSASLDLTVSPEWFGAGSALAGEGKDLTGLQVKASVSF